MLLWSTKKDRLIVFYRLYHICSNWSLINDEIKKLKSILLRNKYPFNFINFCILKFLENIFINNPKTLTCDKKNLL